MTMNKGVSHVSRFTLDLNKTCQSYEGVMTNPAQRMLAEVRKLAPDIISRAAEIEALRHVPSDLIEALRAIGIFRMFVPRSHGGMELDLPSALEIIRALASIEGSIGWNAMIGSAGGIFAPLLPRELYDRVYENGPDTIIAGSIQPAGTAEKEGDHWRINGRWPFVSGCMNAEWMMGQCTMTDGGEPLLDDKGAPMVRAVLLPAHDCEIQDTWHVAGLKGTGSHHIKATNALVLPANIFDLERGALCVPGPLYQATLQLLPLFHAAFHIGVAEGALDDLIELVSSGHQQQRAARPMRDSEAFQFELGRVSAELRAAQAFFRAQVASHWRHALARTLKDEALLIQGTQAGIWVAATCVRVVDACFALAGGIAVYENSPLQRRLRDLHVAAQHAAVHQRNYVGAGKAALTQLHPQFEYRHKNGESRASA
jgi:alkylation response protein AidB-like acyl-CoA dehydrogenase